MFLDAQVLKTTLFTMFFQTTRYLRCFWHTRLQTHRYLQCFFNIALYFFVSRSVQKHCNLHCFGSCRTPQKQSKTAPKPSKFCSLPTPRFLIDFVLIFTNFFTLPISPKNASSPPNSRIFMNFPKARFWNRLTSKNASKCRRERRFFEPNEKNTVKTRVGGRSATRGSKLACLC